MRYFLDGQDKNTVLRFNYLSANERLMVENQVVETNNARVMIDDVSIDFRKNEMLFPEIILNLYVYLIDYDDVCLIDVDGQELNDRYQELDSLKRIKVRYHLTRTEYKWLIDAGGYTADGFAIQLQQTLRKQIFHLPLKLEQLSFDNWTLINAQIEQYDLNKNDQTDFGDVFYQLMRKLIVADDSGQRPNKSQLTKIEIEDEQSDDDVSAVSFDGSMDMHQTDHKLVTSEANSDEIKDVRF